jgi:peptide/nickel transport system substrate-binding protein
MKFPVFKCAVGCAAALAVLAGCGKPKHPLPEPPRVAQCEPGKPGGQLVLAIAGNPRTFNPLLSADGASDAVVRLLFSPLISLDMVTQQPKPGLAESWTVEPDQKTWTFKLRKGLRWSDGEPITADDVVFTWNELMYNPANNQLTYDLFRINGKKFTVTKVDDLTVRVVTPEVFAPFLEYFGGVAILPRHLLARAVQENKFSETYGVRTQPQQIAGSGPFRLKAFRPGKYVMLERNPEYCAVDRQGRRLPYFDEVMLAIAENPAEVTYRFLHNTSAACETIRPDVWPRFEQASTNSRLRAIDLGAGAERNFFWFNQNTNVNAAGKPLVNPVKLKWFQNRKFRQAVSCALDRDRMAIEVYGGRALPVYGFISGENQKWFNREIPRPGHNPDQARALLAEIGMRDRNNDGVLEDAGGNPVEITLISNVDNPARGKTAMMIRDDLKKIGIKVEYRAVDFPTLLEKVNATHDYECGLMGLGGGGMDPASQVNVIKSGEPLHQWFPLQKTPATDWEAKMDSLMDAQMRTLDFARRKKDFDEVQRIWADELPMICTVAPFTGAAIRSDIGNVRPSVAAAWHVTWNIEELYFRKP